MYSQQKFQEAVQRLASGTVNVNGTLQNAQAEGTKKLNLLDKTRSTKAENALFDPGFLTIDISSCRWHRAI